MTKLCYADKQGVPWAFINRGLISQIRIWAKPEEGDSLLSDKQATD